MTSEEKLYSLVTSYIVMEDINEEEKIEKVIDELAQLLFLKEEVNKRNVKNKIMANRSIKLKLGNLIEGDRNYKKWFLNKKHELNMEYWERYKKYLIEDKHFASNVVNTMDSILDNLTDLLGDPTIKQNFQRRGLIVGDVQSGKTSNYTGLLCKAADAGYEVIVLLTGTIEKLRKQTQLRLDEGFVGMDSAAMIKQKENNIIGVGRYNPSIHPLVLTSTINDFRTAIANNLSIKIGQVNQPILFVIKKNVSTLKNLNKWLKIFNQDAINNKINHSLLVIDDESDNASINTNSEDMDPTTINGQIRNLLNMFNRASYVGFTATPFANIFIDPESNDKMENEDLFPKDYIYCLNSPSNYIGARDIFEDEGKYKNMLKIIDKEAIELHIPYKHKKDHAIDAIPSDMKEAINTFLLANVIRDLRGDLKKHRSMLINVSRFTNVQIQLAQLINDYIKEVQASVRQNGQLDSDLAIKNSSYIKSLKYTFDKEYSSLEFKWDDILKTLYKSIVAVVVVTVNQKNKNGLNYEEYEDGLRVIAIGGLSLSRGLTLEGLIISYFYRNSKMYDTLMQMGRWFGYRDKYDDLCRIWMEEESIEWYQQINEATEELRRDIKKYENSGLTPKDFGIRVRSDINTLLVTSRNKMRTASNMEICTSLSGQVIETSCIYNEYESNVMNKHSINNLIDQLTYNGYKLEKISESKNKITYGFRNVEKSFIRELLKDFRVSILNNAFNGESINEFINNYKGNELKNWDIVFAAGSSKKTYELLGKNIPMIIRGYKLDNNYKIIKISGKNKRLGSPSDGAYCLSEKQIDKIKEQYEIENDKSVYTLSQKHYFNYCKDRNPLLIIYHVDLKQKNNQEEIDNTKIKEDIIGLSIGIPLLSESNSCYAKYKINKISQELAMLGEENDFGDYE